MKRHHTALIALAALVVMGLLAALIVTGIGPKRGEPASPLGNGEPGGAQATIARIVVVDTTDPTGRPLSMEVFINTEVRAAFGAEAYATNAGPTGCIARVDAGYGVVAEGALSPDATQGVAKVILDAALRCDYRGGHLTFRTVSEGELRFGGAQKKDAEAALKLLIQAAARDIANGLAGQMAMADADKARVADALKSATHPGVLMEAVAAAGEMRLEATIPDLVRLTTHERQMVVLRAGAALGLMGDSRRTVLRALAEMTTGDDPMRHLVAIQALGDIGGSEAARYLESIAVGHPTPALRALARDAKARALNAPDPDGAP